MALIASPYTSAAANGAAAASLAARLAAGEVRAVVTFAGQGVDVLDELATLVAQRPELLAGAELASDVLAEVAASDLGLASGAYRHGTDVAAWVMDPDGAPPLAYLRGAAIAYPLSLLAQALLWRAVFADALGPANRLGGRLRGPLAGLAGGGAGRRGAGRRDRRRAARPPSAARGGARAADGVGRGRAVADGGGRRHDARAAGAVAGRGRVGRAGQHADTRRRRGPPADLDAVRARLTAAAEAEAAARRAGQRGGAPLRFEWTPLPVDVPFHSPALAEALARFEARRPGSAGRRCSGGAAISRGRSSSIRCAGTRSRTRSARSGADWVLDFGPGTAVARMTAENLRGSGVRVLALASPEGRRVLTSPGAAPAGRDVDVRGVRAGRRQRPPGYEVHARHRPAAGDPRRDDADDGRRGIVAAAANAGYMAELAGGGQPDRRTFALRVEELAGLLEPGREVVFNTLLLDRHLWELHIARGRAAVRRAPRGRAVRGADRVRRDPGRRRGDRAARPAGGARGCA